MSGLYIKSADTVLLELNFSQVDRKTLWRSGILSDRGVMEDAFGHAGQALYSRISGRSIYGIFTRPAVLALSDENRAGIPIQALNLVCRRLIETEIAADSDVPETVKRIAAESGFSNLDQFTTVFQTATGWHPYDWCRSYCRDTMPRRNRL